MSMATILSVCGTIIGCFVGLAAFFNTVQKKTLDSGRMLEKVDNVQKTVDLISSKFDKKNESNDDILKGQSRVIERHETKIQEHDKELSEIKSILNK